MNIGAVRFSDVGWTDITATTAISTTILNALGYEGKAELLSIPVTFQGMKNYGEFMRALVATAREGLAKQWTTQQALDELKKNTKFAVFLGNERIKDVEYGDTPSNRALINHIKRHGLQKI